MTLPDLIEAHDIPAGNSTPSGIITALKQKVPNVLNNISLTSNTATLYGDISYAVNWGERYQTYDNQDVYFQIGFNERYVFATHYSFRGYTGSYYAKQWYLYGFDSEGETPTLITTNTSVGSTFCGSSTGCYNNDWGTFVIPNANRSYRFLRFKIKEHSRSGYWRISFSGFEVFGVYSKDIRYTTDSIKRRTLCFKSCPIIPNNPIYIIFKTILVCS
jgi:hypothetical protein